MSSSGKRSGQGGTGGTYLGGYARRAGLDAAGLETLWDWLTEQLLADEFPQLGEGGHAEVRTPLRTVFVDLPITRAPSREPRPDETPEPFLADLRTLEPRAVSELLPGEGRDHMTLDARLARLGMDDPEMRDAFPDARPRAGTLLIGGPGQGKSTLGQLACQLHRAALVQTRGVTISRVTTALGPFQAWREDEDPGLKLPDEPMLPLRIILPRAASWLAEQESGPGAEPLPALLRFLAAQPSARAPGLAAPTLAAMVAHMPFLLVLDGFDEIGAHEDREAMVAAVRELLEYAAARDGAAVVVATTRPQGYAGELARIGVRLETQHLAPLDAVQALTYAHRLVHAKIADAKRRDTMMKRLRQAAHEPATQYLLQTPLQVTILTALVQNHRAPRERWNLFWRYFDLIYRREIEHETYASTLLAEHRVHIEEIHRRVALILQVEAENTGGAAALMSRERLHGIVDTVLAEDEIADEARAELSACMVEAAERRLVFLVEPEPGRFGFEIRSLQEFMAAWALTQGREAAVEARLVQVARAPLFGNVVLFMTSRFFSQGSELRDVLAERVCPALDADPGDALARATRAGSLLALEVLEEGSSARQPKRARALMACAAGLLDLPPDDDHVRLGRAVSADTAEVLRAALEKRLPGPDSPVARASLGAWRCLVVAAAAGHAFARELATARWPSAPDDSRTVVAVCGWHLRGAGAWLVDMIEARPALFDPGGLMEPHVSLWPAAFEKSADWLRALPRIASAHDRLPRVTGHAHLPGANPNSPWAGLAAMEAPPPAWRAWVAAAQFHVAPSARRLAAVLRAVAEHDTPHAWRSLVHWASWPVAAALDAADHADDLHRFADLAESGALGQAQDWFRAQDAWQRGVSPSALIDAATDSVPWTLDSLAKAPPLPASYDVSASEVPPEAYDELEQRASAAFQTARSSSLRRRLATWCIVLTKGRTRDGVERESFQEWRDALGQRETTPEPLQQFFAGKRERADAIRACVQTLVAQSADDFDAWFSVLHAIAESEEDAVKEALLLEYGDALDASALSAPDHASLRAYAVELMRQLLDETRRSGLISTTTWNRLALPLPHPLAPRRADQRAVLPARPVVLNALGVRRVRGIHALDLAFEPPERERGQWIVFLGPNGAGKSTLLRCLVLALRDLGDPKIWPRGSFLDPYMRHGTRDRESLIAVELRDQGVHETRIRERGAEDFVQEPPHDRPYLVPVFAYGCRRGSALGGAAREVNLEDDDGPEVATLFDEGASLIHAEQWLIGWDGDAARNPASKGIYEAVCQALCALLDVREVAVRDRHVWVGQRHGPDVRLSALSDGYLTSAGWFIDLLARWIELARRHQVRVGPDFMQHMTGLVLLDEIDLHLHPRWQIEVIGRTRALLPRMSFVVSTHNPLTLVGARPEEIWRLILEDGAVRAETGRDTPMLLTGGQIYSRYFGIRDLYPHDLGRKLRRFAFLSGYPGRSDEEEAEMAALHAEIADAGVDPGWDPVPREPVSSAPGGEDP